MEYASTHLNAETVYVWTPIILAIDIGAVMQVFILVLERDGENLPVWKKLMTWVHWRHGRQVYNVHQLTILAGPSPEAMPQANDSQEAAQPPTEVRNVVSLHIVLVLSVFCFVFLIILQLVGLIYTAIGVHVASEPGIQESWCSPAFLDRNYVSDLSCHNYTITPEPGNGIGCIQVAGTQSGFLNATLTVLVIELVLEILDGALLLMAKTDAKLLKSVKLKRPWFTMFFGIGVWLALIGIGVAREENGALPLNGNHVVLSGGAEATCQTVLYSAGLRGAIIAWSDGAFSSFGSVYEGST